MMVLQIIQPADIGRYAAQFCNLTSVLRLDRFYKNLTHYFCDIERVRLCRLVILLSCSVALTHFIGGDAFARENQNIRKASRLLAEEEFTQAYVLYEKEAAVGDPVALFTLGLFELNGWGRPQNEHEACVWFHQAAVLDVPMAVLYTGDCLAKDLIEETQGTSPQYWYERAVDLGLPQAWCSLGQLHLLDRFVPFDRARAIEFCERSAESGIVSAQVSVAKMILQLAADKRDLQKVRFWLEQAAIKGDKEAQFMLAEHLVSSGTSDSQQEEILQLYQQSALQGYLPAYGPTGQLNYEIALEFESQDEQTAALSRAYFWLLLLQKSGDTDLEMKYKHTLKILVEELNPERRRRISQDVSSQQKFLEEQ